MRVCVYQFIHIRVTRDIYMPFIMYGEERDRESKCHSVLVSSSLDSVLSAFSSLSLSFR